MGRLGDEITSHLPWSRRVRSQKYMRLAGGTNSEANGGFCHSKHDSLFNVRKVGVIFFYTVYVFVSLVLVRLM